MNSYEITGYIQIPTTVTVQADTVEDALEIGRDLINDIYQGVPPLSLVTPPVKSKIIVGIKKFSHR
jgi:hypothetical protein